MPTPSQSLLAYVAAHPEVALADALAAYNLETASFRDIPQSEIDANPAAHAVIVRWTDTMLQGGPLAPMLMALLVAYQNYKTINPSDAKFQGAVPTLQASGLLSDTELAMFVEMGTDRNSQRKADGWAAPVTLDDYAAALADKAEEDRRTAVEADFWTPLNDVWNDGNAALTFLRQTRPTITPEQFDQITSAQTKLAALAADLAALRAGLGV